jgi:NAD(P)-dependent dehydrogenase (short-subunit alcohol dehydrogenase family)
MNAQRLSGKVALISGGASGIGLATAQRFAAHGASVVIADLNLEAARAAAAATEGLTAMELDVTDDPRWAEVVDATVARFGKLDALINSAGIGTMRDIESETVEGWRRTMAVNADGVFFGCRHAVRAMKARGGSIVNLSSVSGLIGGRNTAAYNASKGAVRLLTKSVALHCAHRGYGIRCNSVHPTFIETPMVEGMLAAFPDPERTREALIASVPLKRLGQANEVADMLVYLVSDESQFVTGAEFVIDGGMTAA